MLANRKTIMTVTFIKPIEKNDPGCLHSNFHDIIITNLRESYYKEGRLLKR